MRRGPSGIARRAAATATVVIGVVVASLVFTAAPAGAVATGDEAVMSNWVNDVRARYGKAPLTLDASFSDGARGWSSHMASTGRMSHDPNKGTACRNRFPSMSFCAENVGYASSLAQVQRMLEGSSGHRANMLCSCTHLAIGVVRSGGLYWVTQRFAHNGGVGSTYPDTNTPEGDFVRAAYQDFLGRAPTTSELRFWTNRVSRNSSTTRRQFLSFVAYSDEWIGRVIDSYYQIALGRSADADGREHWANVIRTRTMTPAQVAARFYASTEYFHRTGSTNSRWVGDLYQELLHRTADSSGLAHWTDVADRAGRNRVAPPFYDSTESLGVRVELLYRALLQRGADPSGTKHWSKVIRSTGNDVGLAVHLAASSEYFRNT